MTVRLVLASASPRRADVLRQLGLDPEVNVADVDESYFEGETPEEHVERLARTKARAVAATQPDALVLGGDTVVVDSGRVLTKPDGPDEAVSMLMALSGGQHHVYSGVALAGPHGVVSVVVRTAVRMRNYTAETAAAYVATREPLDKAGGYGIQGLGAALVDSIDGDYYAVVGLPVGGVIDLLGRAGWRYSFGSIVPSTPR